MPKTSHLAHGSELKTPANATKCLYWPFLLFRSWITAFSDESKSQLSDFSS